MIPAPASKVLSRDEIVSRFGRPRTETLVFTNGVFDLVHAGHVTYLAEARAMGARLVVGINTDASVRLLGKGPGRPYVSEQDRALVVAALESVDAVCLFDEETPRALIAALLPDVLVKGADYSAAEVVGRDEVEAAGGRTELIEFVAGRSTSDLVSRIRGESE